MLKTILLSGGILLLLAGCNVRRQDKLAADAALRQQVEIKDPTTVEIIDSAYNFGKIAEGQTVTYNYRFKNTGKKVLVITNVGASCGCTVPEKPEEPVKPGETGFIKVKFNSEHHPGQAHKTINVSSNADPGFPELQLTGEVTPKPED